MLRKVIEKSRNVWYTGFISADDLPDKSRIMR